MAYMYVLDGDGEPQLVEDVLEWAEWYEHSGPERVIAQTNIGSVFVSTVFLGYSLGADPPLLFETMAFNPTAVLMGRSTDRQSALAMHERVVGALRGRLTAATN